MRLREKAVAVLAALALVIGLTSGMTAKAAAAPLEATVEKSGDTVTVTVKATDAINFGGVKFSKPAVEGFTYVKTTSPAGLDVTEGEEIILDTAGEINVAAGDTVAVIEFTAGEEYKEGTEYTFTLNILEAYSAALDDYDWVGENVTGTLKEEPETESSEEESSEDESSEAESSEDESSEEEPSSEETKEDPTESSEEESTEPEETTSEEETTEPSTESSGSDETPKTGEGSWMIYVLGCAAAACALGYFAKKRA